MIGRRTLLAAAGSAAISAIAGKAIAQTSTSDAPIAPPTTECAARKADGVHVFKGIRYGASTGGANRFSAQAAGAVDGGTHDALAFPPMTPQPPVAVNKCCLVDLRHREDCLINVGRRRCVTAASDP